jgi:putative protease
LNVFLSHIKFPLSFPLINIKTITVEKLPYKISLFLYDNKFMKKYELLSPAKNHSSGIAAIKCGADAVYIGATRFGARNAAGNSIEDIEKLINFAHKYRSKVYVTINTILDNNEILQAQELINKLYNVGADAIIIQDMGLLELDLPPIPLFASTQTNNTTPDKVKFLEKVGFQRVILARELSLKQIKEIRSKTSIELESFIHGALCVSYSGQCYISCAIGGRSANRGECAQPCRKKYNLIDDNNKNICENKHLLSLKDLNLSTSLENLIDAGVTSFKIEGRLKDEAYIKNIVSYYREKLDFILEEKNLTKSSLGKSFINFTPNPDKTFNRGYTDYFLNTEKNNPAFIDSPKSLGERIGKVEQVFKDYFVITSSESLHNADGICFFTETKELKGTQVNKVSNNKIFPESMNGIAKNTIIYRNHDHEFLKLLENSKIERKIQINLYLTEENNRLIFMAIDEEGITAKITVENSFEAARDKQKADETLQKQLLKLGETDFYSNFVEINLKEAYFIPVKEINEIRRKLIATLEIERNNTYTRHLFKIEKNDFPYREKILDFSGNVLNKYAENFYKRHGVEKIYPAAESGINMSGQKVMTTKYCIKNQLGLCGDKRKLYLTDEHNNKFGLKFNCKNCEMEVYTT